MCGIQTGRFSHCMAFLLLLAEPGLLLRRTATGQWPSQLHPPITGFPTGSGPSGPSALLSAPPPSPHHPVVCNTWPPRISGDSTMALSDLRTSPLLPQAAMRTFLLLVQTLPGETGFSVLRVTFDPRRLEALRENFLLCPPKDYPETLFCKTHPNPGSIKPQGNPHHGASLSWYFYLLPFSLLPNYSVGTTAVRTVPPRLPELRWPSLMGAFS